MTFYSRKDHQNDTYSIKEARYTDRLQEKLSVTKKHNNTIHHSTEITTIETSEKENDKTVYSSLRDQKNVNRSPTKSD